MLQSFPGDDNWTNESVGTLDVEEAVHSFDTAGMLAILTSQPCVLIDWLFLSGYRLKDLSVNW